MKAFNCLLPQAWRLRRAKSLGLNSSEGSEDTDRSFTNPMFEDDDEKSHSGPHGPRYPNPNGSDEIARWRMRVEARRSIYNRLSEIGSFACLACGSMLIYPNLDGNIQPLVEASHWREVFESSEMFKALAPNKKKLVSYLDYTKYVRLEQTIISFGSMIVLSVEDMEDKSLIWSFARFKKWALERGAYEHTHDSVITTVKWLGKLCLAALLGIELPEEPGGYLPVEEGILVPFDGPLRFISDLWCKNRERSKGLQLEEARRLAQLASVCRALPYPSRAQVKVSVETSVETFSQGESVNKRTLGDYSRGLNLIQDTLAPLGDTRTHISIARSASLESTRSEGGRGHYVISRVKELSEQPLTKEMAAFLLGRVDCFGVEILNPLIIDRVLTDKFDRVFRFGDLAYKKASEAMDPVSLDEDRVPPKLGQLIMLKSSKDMLDYGTYSQPFKEDYGILSFASTVGKVKFIPKVERVPVRAGLSVEAGLKTRLTTAAPAAPTQIGQAISNKMREYLSQDPFMRVGFDEADKLWEVLKAYSNRKAQENIARLKEKLRAN